MNDNNTISDIANLGAKCQQFYQILNAEWLESKISADAGNEDAEMREQVLSDLCDYYLEVFEDIVVT